VDDQGEKKGKSPGGGEDRASNNKGGMISTKCRSRGLRAFQDVNPNDKRGLEQEIEDLLGRKGKRGKALLEPENKERGVFTTETDSYI